MNKRILFAMMLCTAACVSDPGNDDVAQGLGEGSNIPPGSEVIEDEHDVEILLETSPLDTWPSATPTIDPGHLVNVGNMRCGCQYWDGPPVRATAVCCSPASQPWPNLDSRCRGVAQCWLGRPGRWVGRAPDLE